MSSILIDNYYREVGSLIRFGGSKKETSIRTAFQNLLNEYCKRILDQYKEKKPRDPTIREKFNTYRFADYKEKVVDLLMRV
jgi:hypothetical protein